jgi:hypothetical protein
VPHLCYFIFDVYLCLERVKQRSTQIFAKRVPEQNRRRAIGSTPMCFLIVFLLCYDRFVMVFSINKRKERFYGSY